jgi:DNA-binding transcriptional MerR regulator
LHHYDRLGLLTPSRTEAEYRLYTEADLERLEQIIALKFLGFSLRQVRDIVDRSWQARVDLFRDIESALGADPAGETAQALARRCLAQMDETCAADPGLGSRRG